MPQPEYSKWSAQQTVSFWLWAPIPVAEKPAAKELAAFLEQEGFTEPNAKTAKQIRDKLSRSKTDRFWKGESWDKAEIDKELESHRFLTPVDQIKERFNQYFSESDRSGPRPEQTGQGEPTVTVQETGETG